MSYLEFLIVFVVSPAVVLAILGWLRARKEGRLPELRWHWLGTLILAIIAFLWTTPWDNYIVANGVWSYGEDRVVAVIGYVPLEEYLFFVLMPAFNSAFYALFFLNASRGLSTFRNKQTQSRVVVATASAAAMAIAAWLLADRHFLYLASTILWFLPALWLQWTFDPAHFKRKASTILVATLVPTFYLCLVDAWAIHDGIWTIHESTRTGWEIASLPFEEAFFFFTTSLLLAQGLSLWHGLQKR